MSYTLKPTDFCLLRLPTLRFYRLLTALVNEEAKIAYVSKNKVIIGIKRGNFVIWDAAHEVHQVHLQHLIALQ